MEKSIRGTVLGHQFCSLIEMARTNIAISTSNCDQCLPGNKILEWSKTSILLSIRDMYKADEASLNFLYSFNAGEKIHSALTMDDMPMCCLNADPML